MKQYILSLVCSQDGGVPLLEQTIKGNTSDVEHFRKVLKSLQSSALDSEESGYYVVDAAMYSKETLEALGDKTKWLSRVPATLKEVQELIAGNEEEMQPLSEGYLGQEYGSEYGGVKQRWFLIHSEQAYKRELLTLDKSISKAEHDDNGKLKKLCGTQYNCKIDAQRAIESFAKQLKYHQICDLDIVEVKKYQKPGKPTETSSYDSYFSIVAVLVRDSVKIGNAKKTKGKFVIATNIHKTDNPNLGIADFLDNYKQQQKVERGFRFLKSNEFLADSVFLKKQSRIIALSMVMCLCLMVYTLAERKLRGELIKQKATLPNQVGKEVTNPTMRWIFQLFEGISVLYKNTQEHIETMVLNLKDIHFRVFKLMGHNIANIYLQKLAHDSS
jgi:transposase